MTFAISNSSRSASIMLLTALVLLMGAWLSLTGWSAFTLNMQQFLASLLHFDPHSMQQQILLSIRTPRALCAMLLGASLAVAGILMQGFTHNTLASPSIFGINAGASSFMALSGIGLPLFSHLPSVVVAACGALLGGGLVLLLGGFFSERPHPLKLILAGIAINALLAGITHAAVILADDRAYSIMSWLAGSLASCGWKQWQQLWPGCVLGLGLAMYVARQLNLLTLGDDVASSLGQNINRSRILAGLAVLLLTASCVSVAGPVGFVGLIVPHIVKRLLPANFLLLVPGCALGGAALIVWTDALSRSIAFPAETPVGAVTALLGTPCFIILALRKQHEH